MSAANKALVRRWFEEVWNQGRLEVIDELLAPDAIAHHLNGPGQDAHGREGFRKFYETMHGAFPDAKFSLDELIAEGDLVAVRWSGRMTHRGGQLGFAATNRPVALTGVNIIRVAGGKLVEGWDSWDRLSMMRQLGVLPATLAANS